MSTDSLQSFVDLLESRGELVRVKERLSPHLEVSEVINRVMKAGGPAVLFEHVEGAAFPLLMNHYGSRKRISLALSCEDLEEQARAIASLVHTRPGSAKDLAALAGKVPELASALPRAVKKARCQDVVLTGADVDLTKLPVLTTWPKDGGPFFTLPNVITKDPDTGSAATPCLPTPRRRLCPTASMKWRLRDSCDASLWNWSAARRLTLRFPLTRKS